MGKKRIIRFSTALLLVALCYVLITRECFAQSVPPGSILWLRADTGVVTQNGLVAIWHDQSGNDNDARMDDTTSRPEFVIDSGHPAVVFQGLNYLEGASVFPVNHDYTVAGVFSLSDTTVVNNIISGNDHAVWLNSSTFLHFHQVGFQVDAIASASSNPNGSSFVAVFDAETSIVRLFIDGSVTVTLTGEQCGAVAYATPPVGNQFTVYTSQLIIVGTTHQTIGCTATSLPFMFKVCGRPNKP